ncbi:MAG: ACT domain-containing protein [Thermodesulfobacteriota bacterium]
MTTSQLSVFAENKPGRLAAVTQVLAKEKINIRATTIATSDTFGVINLIVDDPARARIALQKAGMTVSLMPVLAVVIPDQPGGLNRLTQLLHAEGINIVNAYGFVLEGSRKAIFVVSVDQIEKTDALLAKNGFQTLDADALAAIEPFHYMTY